MFCEHLKFTFFPQSKRAHFTTAHNNEKLNTNKWILNLQFLFQTLTFCSTLLCEYYIMECKHAPFICLQNKLIQGQKTVTVNSHTLSKYKVSIQSYQTIIWKNKFSYMSLTFGAHHISIPYRNPRSIVITTTTIIKLV